MYTFYYFIVWDICKMQNAEISQSSPHSDMCLVTSAGIPPWAPRFLCCWGSQQDCQRSIILAWVALGRWASSVPNHIHNQKMNHPFPLAAVSQNLIRIPVGLPWDPGRRSPLYTVGGAEGNTWFLFLSLCAPLRDEVFRGSYFSSSIAEGWGEGEKKCLVLTPQALER